MPRVTYTQEEMMHAIKLAWATGVRDTLIGMQEGALTDEQAQLLRDVVTRTVSLQGVVSDVSDLAAILAQQPVNAGLWLRAAAGRKR